MALLLIVQIPKVNTKITEFVLSIAMPKGMDVRISQVHGEFPFNVRIESVKVYDEKGPWLSIENLAFSWGGATLFFGNLDIQKIRAKTIEVSRFPVFRPAKTANKPDFSLPLKVDSYSVEQLRIFPWFSGAIRVHGETALNQGDISTFSLYVETIDQPAHGEADLLELKAEIEGNRLKVFAEANDSLSRLKSIAPELADKIVEGDYEFNIDLEANLDGSDVSGTCNGAINNFLSSQEKLNHFIGDQLDWAIDIQLDEGAKNIIAKGDFSTSNNIKANGNLNFEVENQAYNSVLILDLSQVEHLMPEEVKQLTGDMRGIFHAEGRIGGSHQIKWMINGPQTFGNQIDSCAGNGVYENQKGRFYSKIEYPFLSTVLQGTFHLTDNLLYLEQLTLNGNGHKVTAYGVINLTDYTLKTGEMNLAVDNLKPLAQVAGHHSEGSLTGLMVAKNEQVDINLKANQFVFEGWAFDQVTAKVTGQNIENFNVNLKAIQGAYRQTPIESMDLTAHSKAGKGAFLTHMIASKIQWITEGALTLEPQSWKILVNNLSVVSQSQSLISLTKPLKIEVTTDEIKVAANQLKLISGGLKFTDLTFGKTYAGKLSLNEIDPQAFNILPKDYELSGQIKGDLEFYMNQNQPYIKGGLALKDISINHSGRKTRKSFSLATEVVFHDNQWTLVGNYYDSGSSKLTVQGTVLTPTIIPQSMAKVSMRAKGLVDLSVLNSFIWWGDRIKGKLKLDLTSSNTWSQIQHQGSLNLHEGEYENAEFGTVLRHIELNALLRGNLFQITHLSGKDFKEGTFSGKGTVHLGNLTVHNSQISVNLDKLLVANNDITAINVSGDLNIKPGEKGAFIIGGEVKTNFGDVFLEDSMQKIKNINLIEVTEQAHLRLKKPKNYNVVPSRSIYNIKVEIPDNLVIQGRNIKSRWKGDLQVTGPVNLAEIKGFIEVSQGRADILGKQMKIKSGSKISFTTFEGEVEPVLDIRVEKTIRDVMVMIWIHGMAIDPKIEFISIPALAQEEVVSLLLFGKSLNSVSAAQSLQLATRLAAIKTGGDGVNLMDQFQQAFGLDEFSVGSRQEDEEIQEQQAGTSTGYAVRAGKQLNDKIYFGVEQGLGADADTKAVVNIDVTKETKLNLDVGSAGGSVGYFWEKRY